MVYVKKSPLRKVKDKKLKNKKITPFMMDKLVRHRDNHKKNPKNKPDKITKHMKVMRDLMKQGISFNKSHIEAQNKYSMV